MEVRELRILIKETMREVFREERLQLCKILIPCITDEEQAEIEAEFGSPQGYHDDEVADMTSLYFTSAIASGLQIKELSIAPAPLQ